MSEKKGFAWTQLLKKSSSAAQWFCASPSAGLQGRSDERGMPYDIDANGGLACVFKLCLCRIGGPVDVHAQ